MSGDAVVAALVVTGNSFALISADFATGFISVLEEVSPFFVVFSSPASPAASKAEAPAAINPSRIDAISASAVISYRMREMR